MTDLLVLAAFVFSFLAFARTRQAHERFTRDIAFLQSEVARLSADRPQAALAAGAAMEVVVVDENNEVDGATASEAVIEPETLEAGEPPAPPPETEPQKPRESFESWLGARWAVWVGGIALALGGIFLVKVSIDAGLLSPAVRLVLAALFGAGLMAGGEMILRRGSVEGARRFGNAMIPGILTAAGAVTILGAIFAAHAVYAFIGPTTAFVLMGLVSFFVLFLSLRHGQALAGLGLAASLVTPLLIDADDPSPWSLFAFLSLVWLASMATARIGRWRIVPALANIGLALWGTVYLIAADPAVTLPVSLSLLVLIFGHAFVWPAGADDAEPETVEDDHPVPEPTEPTGEVAEVPAEGPVAVPPRRAAPWRRLLLPRHAPIILTGAFAVLMTGLSLIGPLTETIGNPTYEFLAVTAALGLLGALRVRAVSAALAAGLMAVLGVSTLATLPQLLELSSIGVVADRPFSTSSFAALSLATIFIALCAFALHRHSGRARFAMLWAGLAAVTSVACVGLSFLILGTYAFDPLHGLAATVAAVAFLTLAELFFRRDARLPPVAQGLLLAGALGHLVIAAHALSDGLGTVLAMAVFAAAFIAATKVRNWVALPWVGALGFVLVLARIGWEPTIVGPLALGRTPVFNALLPGYGVPALLALGSAYALRDWPSDRLRNALQAIASLFALLTLAILVRHAMNGGQLQGGAPSLAEQSIYTLLVIGGSAILMRLDLSRPGSFLRYGSIGLGVLSLLMTLSAHLFVLNPYLTGEMLGPYPLFDLLLIGYLLPGLAYAGLARVAVGRRPPVFVAALATAAALLAFAWATLSVRRAWQGPGIADWKGFLAGETYTYSVVWLVLGVVLLVASLRFHSRVMRIVSGVLVFVTVLKVFLFDMANLEGLLRALSFIGLGLVLIGIGLFYQKVLTSRPKQADDAPAGTDP
ncbi:hypothetical protein ASG39_06575 [Rhizobium sp. Leaf371]|uniref:DUF2339 domain-containing protein n=1 Tax=Rhizobium sp. Leaf371 TaxID=1736355 RepID=UPI00071341A2|nr:DUF2339 domain-containing protein [Rhizobium sp. Leaf371]KQS67991.1 hypothetical protein ASG39_06575 [Rhizobium sp. Leaf371]